MKKVTNIITSVGLSLLMITCFVACGGGDEKVKSDESSRSPGVTTNSGQSVGNNSSLGTLTTNSGQTNTSTAAQDMVSIKFDSRGGSPVQTIEVPQGQKISLKKYAPTYEGRAFVGWGTKEGKMVSPYEFVANETTLYAIYSGEIIDKSYVYFGKYPQTRVESETLIAKLNKEVPNDDSVITFENEKYLKKVMGTETRYYSYDFVCWDVVTNNLQGSNGEDFNSKVGTVEIRSKDTLGYTNFANSESSFKSYYDIVEHREKSPNDFVNSNIKNYLEDMFDNFEFTEYEMELLKPTVIEERTGYGYTFGKYTGYFVLPTIRQCENVASGADAYKAVSKYAVDQMIMRRDEGKECDPECNNFLIDSPSSCNEAYTIARDNLTNNSFNGYRPISVTEYSGVRPKATLTFAPFDNRDLYNVTFNTTGGSEVSSVKAHKLDSTFINNITPPTKEGCSFAGWYLDEGLTQKFTSMPDKNITLYAKWELINYKITYVTDAYSNSPDHPATMTINDVLELKPIRPYGPHVDNTKVMNFVGWFLDEGYTLPVSRLEHIKEDTTVYAKFEDITFNVVYHLNADDAINAEINTNKIKAFDIYGSGFRLGSPTRPGYEFKGWFTDASFRYNITKLEDLKDYELYAKWEACYTVVAHMEGVETNDTVFNSFPMSVGKEDSSKTFTFQYIPSAGEGKSFLGYFSKPDTSGYKYPFNANIRVIDVAKNYADEDGVLHIYPVFSTLTKINFIVNEGTALIDSYYVLEEDKNYMYIDNTKTSGINYPTASKEGYEFIGWYLDSEFNEEAKYYKNEYPETEYSLYPKFVRIFNLTVLWGNGLDSATIMNVKEGSNISTYSYFEIPKYRNGKCFAGFYKDQQFTQLYDLTCVDVAENVYVKWNSLEDIQANDFYGFNIWRRDSFVVQDDYSKYSFRDSDNGVPIANFREHVGKNIYYNPETGYLLLYGLYSGNEWRMYPGHFNKEDGTLFLSYQTTYSDTLTFDEKPVSDYCYFLKQCPDSKNGYSMYPTSSDGHSADVYVLKVDNVWYTMISLEDRVTASGTTTKTTKNIFIVGEKVYYDVTFGGYLYKKNIASYYREIELCVFDKDQEFMIYFERAKMSEPWKISINNLENY